MSNFHFLKEHQDRQDHKYPKRYGNKRDLVCTIKRMSCFHKQIDLIGDNIFYNQKKTMIVHSISHDDASTIYKKGIYFAATIYAACDEKCLIGSLFFSSRLSYEQP